MGESVELLPEWLYARCARKLTEVGVTRVTFRAGEAELSSTEVLLGRKTALKCREVLGRPCRLHFGQPKPKKRGRKPHPKKAAALKLVKAGWPIREVAIVIGVHAQTIVNWGGRFTRVRPKSEISDSTALEMAEEHFADRGDSISEIQEALGVDMAGLTRLGRVVNALLEVS